LPIQQTSWYPAQFAIHPHNIPSSHEVEDHTATVNAASDDPLSKPLRPPKKRGVPPEQYKKGLAAFHQCKHAQIAEIAAFQRKGMMAHEIESYIWRAMDVHGTCSVAKKYDGQTIRCDQAPKEGHVGEGECGSPDYCRCTKIPVIPGSLDLFMMMMRPEVFGFSSSKEL
jgi:hypothetical protein